MEIEVEAHRTALRRNSLSRPVAIALADGLLPPGTSFFDYGCGLGDDVQRLQALGYPASGWDPMHFPFGERRAADVVNLGYVINVIEDPSERADALRSAWDLTRCVLIVAARLDWEERFALGQRHGDGILTGRRTFQKFYTQEELRQWIDQILGVRSLAAAPGVFYVFRDEISAQRFLAARVRHRTRVVRHPGLEEAFYRANRAVLDPLIAFVTARGRQPAAFEVPDSPVLVERFGSLKAALATAARFIDDTALEAARRASTDDLTVYLALAAFRGRPRFRELPVDLQLDVKAFFGSYQKACRAADALLFGSGDHEAIDRACRESPIGKLTREALYVHVSALARLSPILRVYEGCARALAGTAEDATIIKLHRFQPKVSYLSYPDFDQDPHPALAVSVRADLRQLHLKYRDFRGSANPPILHRKETFVDADYPGRELFASLTAKEEELGLLDDPQTIGTREHWLALLEARGLRIVGHNIVPVSSSDTSRAG